MNNLPNDMADLGRRIAVDLATPVKVELEGIEIPLQSFIVGLEHNQYIIIKAPEPYQRIEHKLFKGANIIVRYLAHGTVYAFQTKVMEVIGKPLSLLFLEFPRIIQHHDLREDKRFSCHVPAKILHGDTENLGWILDLALNGCRCLIPAAKNPELMRCEMEAAVQIKCILPGCKDSITLSGVIKNLKRTRKEIDLGINFAPNMAGDSRKMLVWFLSAINSIAFR